MLSPLHFDTNQQNTMTGCMFNPYCAREDLIESLNIVYFTEMLKISVYFSTAEQKRDVCSCSLKRRRRLAYRFFFYFGEGFAHIKYSRLLSHLDYFNNVLTNFSGQSDIDYEQPMKE